MTELDRDLVRRKLSTIVENLGDLTPIAALGLDEYRRDRMRRKAAERLLQEIIEAAVDVNLHMVRSGGANTPHDYYGSFIAVGALGAVSEDLALALAPCTGLRNRLVHEYDQLDDGIVLTAIAEAVGTFPKYVAAVESFISTSPRNR